MKGLFNYVQSEIYRYKKSKGFLIFNCIVWALVLLGFGILFESHLNQRINSPDYKSHLLGAFSDLIPVSLIIVPMVATSIVYKTRGPQTQIIGYGMSRSQQVLGDFLCMIYLVIKFAIITFLGVVISYTLGRLIFTSQIAQESLQDIFFRTLRAIPATVTNAAIILGCCYATGKVAIGNTIYVFLTILIPDFIIPMLIWPLLQRYQGIYRLIYNAFELLPNAQYFKVTQHMISSTEKGLGWLRYFGIMAILCIVFLGIGMAFYQKKEI